MASRSTTTLLTALGAVLLLPALAAAQAQTAFLAQQRYDAGMQAYEADDDEAALEEFRASLALVASPNTRLMIARVLRNLSRFAEALMEYDLAAHGATDRARTDPRFAATRDAAEQEGAAIRDRVGHVRVSLEPAVAGCVVRLGERTLPLEALALAVPVDAGAVWMRVSAPGHAPFEREIEVVAGEETVVAVELEPRPVSATSGAASPTAAPEAPSSGLSAADVVGWTSTVVALAAVGLGAGLWVATQERFDALSVQCGEGPCPGELAAAVSEGRAYEGGLWSMVATAGVAALIAVVSFAVAAGEARPARALLQPREIRF